MMSVMDENDIQHYIDHVVGCIEKDSQENDVIYGHPGDQTEQGSLHRTDKDIATLQNATKILRYIEYGIRD